MPTATPGDLSRPPPPSARWPAMVFALFSIAVLSLGHAIASSQAHEVKRVALRELQSINALKAAEISRWRASFQAKAATLQRAPAALSFLESAVRRAPTQAWVVPWLNAIGRMLDCSEVTLFDEAGVPIASNLPGSAPTPGDGDLVREALSKGDLRLSERLGSGESSTLQLAVPLVGPGAEEPFGALLLRHDATRFLLPLVSFWPSASRSAETLLVQREGDFVEWLNQPRHARPGEYSRSTLSRTELPAVQAVLGREGAFEGRDYRGEPVLSYLTAVPGSRWHLVSKIDRSEVLEPVRARVGALVACVASLIGLAGTALLLWWRRQSAAAASRSADLQRQLVSLAAQIDDIYLLVTPEGRIVEANDRAVAAYGHPRERLLGMNVRELRASAEPDLAASLRASLEGAARLETVHRRADGSTFDAEVIGRRVEVGGRPYVQAAVRDVSARRAAEAELRASQERLSATLRSISEAVLSTDPEGRIERMNAAAEQLTGRAEAEAKGLPLSQLMRVIDPLTREPLEGLATRAMREGQAMRRDGLALLAGGREVSVSKSAAPIRGPDGSIQGAVVVLRDISAEREASRLTAFHSLLLSGLAEPVVGFDKDLRIVSWNAAAERLYGYAAEEVLGRGNLEALRSPPDFAGEREARVRRLVETGRVDGDMAVLAKDGRRVVVEASTVALRGPEGEVLGYVSVHRDLTERRQAEQALRLSEAKFRAALREAGIGMLLFGPDGRVLETNRALQSMLGYAEEELRGLPVTSLSPPAGAARIDSLLQDLSSGARDGYAEERTLLRRDGTPVEATLRVSAVHDDAGQLRFVVAVAEDVTVRKALEIQLRRQDRLASLGTLAAGMAHEINNPLAYVLGNLSFVRSMLPSSGTSQEEEFAQALAEAEEGAGRIREVVRDLKAFAREEVEGEVSCELGAAVRGAVKLASKEVKARARMEVEVEEGLPPVRGASQRLSQVFVNLLLNAAQAIPEGAKESNQVTLRARRDGPGWLEVEVRDTGRGIAPEAMGRIFDPFFSTKPVGAGMGMGLPICHGIVSALGGEIRVSSEPGQGASFRVRLPMARAEQGEAAPASPAPAVGGQRRARVLVVEDEPLVARVVARALEPHHEVVLAGGGEEALRLLDSGAQFDALVCDLLMPGMTGMELHARVVRREPRLARATVFVTGGAYTNSARDFLEAVSNPRLAKPFDPARLRAEVEALLRDDPVPAG